MANHEMPYHLIKLYKNMYNPRRTQSNCITAVRDNITIGETIEQKIRRITTTQEPISDSAQKLYTERKDGVKPEYNIRTDRMELAVDAMDKGAKNELAKRKAALEAKAKKENPEQPGTAEPTV